MITFANDHDRRKSSRDFFVKEKAVDNNKSLSMQTDKSQLIMIHVAAI